MDINPTLVGSYEILLSSVLVVMMYSCTRLSLLFLGFLHVSMYQQVDSSLLGHVDLSEQTPLWNTLSICPTGLTNDQNTGKKLSVVGKGSGLSFTVQIAEVTPEIAFDEPHTVNVQGDEVSIFQFIPPLGISDKQLDITATSQSTVATYLKVSQNCKEVVLQEDLENINYKKESLRLSFATKGRITLSSVSIPSLTDSVSRWFIGIGLKKVSGDVKLRVSKNVTLKLTRSFDYNYLTPICILFFVSLVIGILVSIVAYFLFEESLTKVKVGKGKQGHDNVDLKVSVCDMRHVIIHHWFSSPPPIHTYSSITGTAGTMLMVAASLFVFANWDMMIQEGDRDNCYYNDFCYRVGYHDIPFNLIISYLTYIVHGLILVVWVLMLETKAILRYHSSTTDKEAIGMEERNFFSFGYAFSCALVFQGLFSALFHLCPNMSTFRFDVVFLFIIAGLSVLLLYNGIGQNPFQNEKVDATDFFLIFIMPHILFNYFSEQLNSNSGLNKKRQWLFYAFLIIWWCIIFFSAFCKLNMRQKLGSDDVNDKFDGYLFILSYLLMPGAIYMYYFFSDLTQSFLLTYFTCSAVAIVTKGWLLRFSKCKFKERHVKGTLQNLFIFFTFIILVAAVGVLKLLPTTNKTSSPENSRDQNQECVILGFFDWHALGHFLFSFALLMGAFTLMFISSEPEKSPQAEIMNQEHKGKKRV